MRSTTVWQAMARSSPSESTFSCVLALMFTTSSLTPISRHRFDLMAACPAARYRGHRRSRRSSSGARRAEACLVRGQLRPLRDDGGVHIADGVARLLHAPDLRRAGSRWVRTLSAAGGLSSPSRWLRAGTREPNPGEQGPQRAVRTAHRLNKEAVRARALPSGVVVREQLPWLGWGQGRKPRGRRCRGRRRRAWAARRCRAGPVRRGWSRRCSGSKRRLRPHSVGRRGLGTACGALWRGTRRRSALRSPFHAGCRCPR